MIEPSDVHAFLGGDASRYPAAMVQEHVDVVTGFVASYTRDNGFMDGEPNPALMKVIISAAARSVANPTLDKQHSVGQFSETPGSFYGFTLPELAVLNRYRARAL